MANGQGKHAAHGARRGRSARLASESSSISTIHAGQGARVTTRHNAAEAADRARHSAEQRYLSRHPEARPSKDGPRRSGRNTVILVVAAIAVLVVVFFAFRFAMLALFSTPSDDPAGTQAGQTTGLTDAEYQAQEDQRAHDDGSEQAGVGGTVTYAGSTFSLQEQGDGLWGVVRTTSSGDTSTLFMVEGTPVAIARRGNTILVPENRDGGWDVVCYVVDGNSAAGYLVGSDGSMLRGEGDVASVELADTVLHVTDSSGATTDVSLV